MRICGMCDLDDNGKCSAGRFPGKCIRAKVIKPLTDLGGKCGSCRWYDYKDMSSIGCRCTNPKKEWQHKSSPYRCRTTKACKLYVEGRKDGKNV